MRDIKELLGEDEFREIISSDDNGLGFLLGLVESGGVITGYQNRCGCSHIFGVSELWLQPPVTMFLNW